MDLELFKLSKDSINLPQSKSVLITGAGGGIGLATATLLHSYGNNVVALDLKPPSDSTLTRSPRFLFQKCDVTSWQSQRAAFAAGVKKFGRLDYVFVNAGLGEHEDQMFKEYHDSSGQLQEPDRRTLDVDIRAVNDTVKLALYHLRNDKRGQKGGSIVMTASLAGYLASAGAPLYSAAKHGVVGFMRALKNDTAKLGISISVIAPGITLTNIILGRRPGQSLQDWAKEMRAAGVPINDAETVALTVAYLMSIGMDANGQGVLIQDNKMQDLEGGIAKTRKMWMGEEMLKLFRGGRNAPLFPNKL